nr:PilT/PilU family type 4a pilus ATPase [uncultured Holophaga sp.]
MNLEEVLTYAARAKASDIHLRSGMRPTIRVDGVLYAMPKEGPCPGEAIATQATALMNERQRQAYGEKGEVNLTHTLTGLGRYRINAFRERGSVALAIRPISLAIPTLEDLNLPPIIRRLCQEERGLVLVTGSTGCGKSSTLAAMIDIINTDRNRNILTIEDPIEYLHQDRRSIICQREIGEDTPDYATALLGALRQDPDVILVGEMRDLETITTALLAAETGHLVLATLHTMDAAETINRIISACPPIHQRQIRLQLASVLKGVVSQRLVPRAGGRGRVPAVEVMLATARVKECIDDLEKSRYLAEAIAQGEAYGMQSFDQSLMQLCGDGLISFEEALRQSSNPEALSLRASGISSLKDAGKGSVPSPAVMPEAAPIEIALGANALPGTRNLRNKAK